MVVLKECEAGAGVSKVNTQWVNENWGSIAEGPAVNKQELHHRFKVGALLYCGASRNDVILSHRCAISKISILRSTVLLLVYYTTTGCM
jgi:hypothetical protein